MKYLNILQVNKFFYIKDGTSRYFINLSDLLNEKGHHVIPFSMKDYKNKRSIFSKYFVNNISFVDNNISNPFKIILRMFYSFESRSKIRLLVKSHRVDIAHIHTIYHHISPSILPELKKNNIPIIVNVGDYHLVSPCYNLFHNGKICEVTKPNKYYQSLFHKCVKNSYLASFAEVTEKYINSIFKWDRKFVNLFIVPTEFVKNKLIEYKIEENKIKVLPYYIDYIKYKPNYHPGKYILFFGGLYEYKGLFFLLKLMKLLPNIPCLIAGEGSLKNKLRDILLKEDIRNVKILGYQDERKLIDLISNSKFTIMPSLWYEGFGLVILEANACGKPVIASNIGGISEVVKNNINGLLFNPNSIPDCINKIQTLWNDSKLTEKLGRSARIFVKTEFGPDKHYKKLMDIYKQVIDQNKFYN